MMTFFISFGAKGRCEAQYRQTSSKNKLISHFQRPNREMLKILWYFTRFYAHKCQFSSFYPRTLAISVESEAQDGTRQ
jgi:hypothetical protein